MEEANPIKSEITADFSNYTSTKDFRANGYPCDEKGKPLYTSDSGEDYISYIDWLADYIATVDLEPIQEQLTLCEEIKYDSRHSSSAQNSIYHIAFDFVYGSGNRGRCNKEEREIKKKFWPRRFGPMPVDLTHRVPLAIVLKKIETHAERVDLLRSYYSEVGELLDK
jgi:hypothetical protein